MGTQAGGAESSELTYGDILPKQADLPGQLISLLLRKEQLFQIAVYQNGFAVVPNSASR